jgi:hypothetical protein
MELDSIRPASAAATTTQPGENSHSHRGDSFITHPPGLIEKQHPRRQM